MNDLTSIFWKTNFDLIRKLWTEIVLFMIKYKTDLYSCFLLDHVLDNKFLVKKIISCIMHSFHFISIIFGYSNVLFLMETEPSRFLLLFFFSLRMIFFCLYFSPRVIACLRTKLTISVFMSLVNYKLISSALPLWTLSFVESCDNWRKSCCQWKASVV